MVSLLCRSHLKRSIGGITELARSSADQRRQQRPDTHALRVVTRVNAEGFNLFVPFRMKHCALALDSRRACRVRWRCG